MRLAGTNPQCAEYETGEAIWRAVGNEASEVALKLLYEGLLAVDGAADPRPAVALMLMVAIVQHYARQKLRTVMSSSCPKRCAMLAMESADSPLID